MADDRKFPVPKPLAPSLFRGISEGARTIPGWSRIEVGPAEKRRILATPSKTMFEMIARDPGFDDPVHPHNRLIAAGWVWVQKHEYRKGPYTLFWVTSHEARWVCMVGRQSNTQTTGVSPEDTFLACKEAYMAKLTELLEAASVPF